MDIIRSGIGTIKTIRNAKRLKEIIFIFAKYGFSRFIYRGISTKLIPKFALPQSDLDLKEKLKEENRDTWMELFSSNLRQAFEELGPVFIKLGQLLSTREDMFDPIFINEMKVLKDKAKNVEFSEMKKELENSLGGTIEEFFDSFNSNPIGIASVGIAYKCNLKQGKEVVVKVRRPNIKNIVERDCSILIFLAEQLEKISNEVKYLGISKLTREFYSELKKELNFHLEAKNAENFKKNVEEHDTENLIYIPKVYKEFSRENILVIEYLNGIPFSDRKRIQACQDELIPRVEKCLSIFMTTFLQDGFFHADLHEGNFFYLEDKRIGVIDFGLMGRIGKKSRHNLIAIIYALISSNYENLVYEFLDIAEFEKMPDIDALTTEVRSALSPYIGLGSNQVDLSDMFYIIITILTKHQIRFPRNWFIIFRTFTVLDGIKKTIGHDFNLYELFHKDIATLIQRSMNKETIIEELAWSSRDILSSLRIMPRHLKWYIREWAKKDYVFRVENSGYEKELSLLSNALIFLGLAIISSLLVLCGVLAEEGKKLHLIGWSFELSSIFWMLALFLFCFSLFFIKKSSLKK